MRWETEAEWRLRLGVEKWMELKCWQQKHRWHPHQLRHSSATIYRREADFETAKIVLGHRTDAMTELYAERDARKADEAVVRIG
jgi:integrase